MRSEISATQTSNGCTGSSNSLSFFTNTPMSDAKACDRATRSRPVFSLKKSVQVSAKSDSLHRDLAVRL